LNKWFIFFLPLVLIVIGDAAWTQTYHGKVLDAETGKALEGAVFVIIWFKKPMVSMDGPQYFHNAKETLTDVNGEFSIDGSPGIDFNPFTYVVDRPIIAIFKPGYGPFPTGYVRDKPLKETLAAMEKEGAVIKMPNLKTSEELRKYTDRVSMWIPDVPSEKVPILIKLINVQRDKLGFSPIWYKGFC
jgi:hypothetical protein